MATAPKSFAKRMREAREERGLVASNDHTRVAYDKGRGSSASRGYGRRWRRLRRRFLARNPLCVECLANGRTAAASEVDHIKPKRRGGSDDDSNLQALCKPCHTRKTNREARAGTNPTRTQGGGV